MDIQDYKDELKQDLTDYAREGRGYYDSFERFEDACWTADSVTGNGSGSYTFNRWEAEENIKDLIFSDELLDMFREFGYDRIPLEKGPEFIDVSIRCFLLNEVLYDNKDELTDILGLNKDE